MSDPTQARRSLPGWPALAAVVTVGAMFPWVTIGRFSMPPPTALGVAVALALVLAIVPGRRPLPRLDMLLVIAIGLAAASPHLAPGVLEGHDMRDHIWGAWAYLQAWQAGDWLPIWLHHLGLGMPLPMFYGPLPFWVMAPFAGFGTQSMVSGSFVLAEVVAALSAWWVVRQWTRHPAAALLAATAWAFAPYRLLDTHYRLALGESWSLALFPWLLWSFHAVVTVGGSRAIATAAAVTALVALSHPISLVTVAALLPVLWLIASPPWGDGGWRRSLRSARRGAIAGLAGLALAGFFTVPLIAEAGTLDLAPSFISEDSRPTYSQHGTHLSQLVRRDLQDSISWSYRESWEKDARYLDKEMPYYFGLILLAALIAALAALRRAGDDPLPALGVLGLAALAHSLAPVSHWTVTWPLVDTLQFPWRFLGPAGAAAVLALGLLAARAAPQSGLRGRLLIAAAAVVALADGFPTAGAIGRIDSWHELSSFAAKSGIEYPTPVDGELPFRVDGHLLPPRRGELQIGSLAVYREYYTPAARRLTEKPRSPLTAVDLERVDWSDVRRVPALPYARLLTVGDDRPHGRRFRRAGGWIEVDVGRAGGRVVVAEQYFPGWQVDLGDGWREAGADESGLLTTSVPPETGTVRFRFYRWRNDRLAGWLLAGATALTLLLLWRRERSGRIRDATL